MGAFAFPVDDYYHGRHVLQIQALEAKVRELEAAIAAELVRA
jgi:hypothetical protein